MDFDIRDRSVNQGARALTVGRTVGGGPRPACDRRERGSDAISSRHGLPELIRIVSRSSPMALAQVERDRTAVVPVTASGDRWPGDLARLGGKCAFTKEVDAALMADEADLAAHDSIAQFGCVDQAASR
ncbi:hypothetical protein GCM10010430_80090 [Kitasatospora cystarginea]|uniref:Porphobilinogen deaminase N-terminal domain-containing protein n=1 Tax=Kitasatospora cystarginea TaxID=58350 RepID=A0ABP5RZ78_9ACTN